MDGYKIKTARFLKHVKDSGGILTIIAKRMGVDRSSLWEWLQKNPSMWEYVYTEREQIVDIAESKLIGKLNDSQDWAIKFVLGSTNRGKRRGYNEGPNVVVNTGENTGPTYKFVIERPDDNRDAVETNTEAVTGV